MISVQCDVHIHSTSGNVCIRDTEYSCWQYYDKNTSKDQVDRLYSADKSSFALARGQRWFIHNRRSDKLKSSLRELEELMLEHTVILTKWRTDSLVQLFLQNAVIATIVLNKVGDVAKIWLDKFLVGKIPCRPTGVWFTKNYLVLVYLEPKLTLVSFSKPLDFEKRESLSQADPRIHHHDLVNSHGRRLERRLQVDEDADQAVVWWSLGDQEVYPWTPQLKEEDRANLLVYRIKPELRLQGFYRTRSEPLLLRFLPGNLIHFIGQTGNLEGGLDNRLENTVLCVENPKNIRKKLSRCVSVPSSILCCCLLPNSDLILFGSLDGTIYSFDQVENKIEHHTKAGFIPTQLSVSPEGVLVLATSQKGYIQCFDVALNPVLVSSPGEESPPGSLLHIGKFFKSPVLLCEGAWSPRGTEVRGLEMGFTHFLTRIQNGPLVTLRLSAGIFSGGKLGPVQVVGQYLNLGLYDEVLRLLSQLSWLHTGETVLQCLSMVFNKLIRAPYSKEQEAWLEMCLAVFLAPNKPISEEIREEYADNVRDLSRRFFSHLLKNQQLIKGFQLAVDLNDYDLFVDVHYAALNRNLTDLAQAAMIKAKASYNKLNSEPNSRSGSSQSFPSPFHLLTGDLMQPGQSATFLKTTSARKIFTNDYSRTSLDVEYPDEASFRYESILSLPVTSSSQMENVESVPLHSTPVVRMSPNPGYNPLPSTDRFQVYVAAARCPPASPFFSSPYMERRYSSHQYVAKDLPSASQLSLAPSPHTYTPQHSLPFSAHSQTPQHSLPSSENTNTTQHSFAMSEFAHTPQHSQAPSAQTNTPQHSLPPSAHTPQHPLPPSAHTPQHSLPPSAYTPQHSMAPAANTHTPQHSLPMSTHTHTPKHSLASSAHSTTPEHSLATLEYAHTPQHSLAPSAFPHTPQYSRPPPTAEVDKPFRAQLFDEGSLGSAPVLHRYSFDAADSTAVDPQADLAPSERFVSQISTETPRDVLEAEVGVRRLSLKEGRTTQESRETILSAVVQTRTISRHKPPQYNPPPEPNLRQTTQQNEEIKVIHFGVV